ncbi:hypothetical protein YC2023_116614 [Brassica napus]
MASSCYSGHCRASSNISPWEELQTASVFVGYLGCSLPHFPFFVHRRLRISDGKVQFAGGTTFFSVAVLRTLLQWSSM